MRHGVRRRTARSRALVRGRGLGRLHPRCAPRLGRFWVRCLLLAARSRADRGGTRAGGQESTQPPRYGAAIAARATCGASMNPAAVPLALYLHMPWCVRKCPYCDFNSHQLKGTVPDAAYIDALLADFRKDLPLVAGRRVETVFFGGGTPSLFAPKHIGRLLAALRDTIEFAPDAEITLEANPGTIE